MKNATTGETVRTIGTLGVFVGESDATGFTCCRIEPVAAEGEGCSIWVRAEADEVAQYGETFALALAFAAARAWRDGERLPLWASREIAAE